MLQTKTVADGDDSFEVTVFEHASASPVILFAAGAGGSPARHEPLLSALCERGCSVIAPRFDLLIAAQVTEAQLVVRARRLQLALDAFAANSARVVGVGHSIGAMLLLAMAGAQPWLGPERKLSIMPDERLEAVAMLAPAAGYFAAPGALDAVRARVSLWAGTRDGWAPPASLAFMERALSGRVAFELRVIEEADHFSFMNSRPPNSPVETMPDARAFHDELAQGIAEFALR